MLRTWLSRILASSPLAYFPVRVRMGPARGARWTLLPFSHNWRRGGEGDLGAGLRCLVRTAGAVCWDFGAHFGIHTVGMAMQVGPEGQVAAFEPDPVAFARLAHHVRWNGLTNVVLLQAAASSTSQQRRMISFAGLGSTMSHFKYPGEVEPSDDSTLLVESQVPDSLVAAGRIRMPDLIKVDVQGHGAEALLGSLASIRSKLPVIIFSSHSPTELDGTRALLEPLGYVVSELSGAPMSWDALESATGILRSRSRT